ncbi:hypothetical protein L3Y34_013950 [Caenorhabditis briggsae]|uniref:C2H2-type domain-containing protein n=2 Tax=Caenorhabditis briggsae TaxID=6238 RepID=A0AAE9IWV2_CAEBR|nr:hypothetical protein L3Y34_013950 [Caenorhabditis briggsae]
MSSVPTTSSAPVTPSAPAAAASADDSLRRSKRRKFTLDVVAAAHGNNQKRRKRDYGEVADSDDDAYDDLDDSEAGGGAYAEQLNVETGGGAGSDGRRRSRRSTAVFHGYQQDTYDNWVEMSGPFACHKCPSRYESKSSLANHAKMHTKERKEFKCELCCFSSQTLKSLTWHNNVHKQFGVLSPQISPVTTAGAIPAPDAASAGSPASDSSDSAPAPEAQNTSMDSSTSTASLVAPDLSVEPLPEAPEGHDDDGDKAAPLLDAENPEDEEDEDDGPPVLEREDEQREVDQEREVSESPDHLAVRKSGRTSKPTQKKLEEKKPRKYTKQQQKTLPILDALPPVLDDTTASGRLQEDTPSPRGSLPTTSAPLSVTPPPVVQKQTPPVVQKETSKRGVPCSKCPYTCSSVTRLQRHFRGHTLDEGYICPEPECHFMCRKRGFIAKHYILHSKPLLGQPKFCRKVINKKNGKVTIEEVEDPNHPSTGEEPEDLDTSVEDVTMEEEEAPPKLEVEEKPKKRKYEKKSPEQKRLEKEKKEQKELKKLNKMKASEKMPELQIEKVEEESEDVPEEKMPLIPLTSKARVGLIAKAQIKSHKTRIIDGVPHKQCNIGECDFLTTSITQLIFHKTNKHGAKKAFPFHRFLCSTCGYRTTNFGALRAHKMTNHLTAPNRFHRTFYLKEAIGDKFYIKYFTGIGATPPPPPLLVLDDSQPSSSNAVAVTAPMKFPHVPVVAPTMRQMLFFAQQDEDVDDEPFDSIFRPEALANLTPEEFAALKMVEFCCNVCPYRAPSMNRCQRHYAKHFTNDPIKCKMCSWTARGEEVMKAHEEMHRVDLAEKAAKLAAEQHAMKTDEEKAKHVEHEEFKQTYLFKSIHKWCLAEKAKRPELGEPFTRKMIDSIKGFACTDCPYTSKYRGDMRSHKKRHDIEQSFRCVQCTYTTNRPVSLKDHMKQHLVVNNSLANGSGATHPIVVNQGIPIGTRRGFGKDRIYNCSRCPYTTVSIGCLWRHARYHRRVPKHSICSNCTYSSLDTKKIEEHILVHLAMGGSTEQIPFVKRVDHHGRPVSSLTDLNGGPDNKAGERKVQKRKLEKAEKQEKQEVKVPEEDPESLEDEDEEDDEDEVPRSSSKRPSRYNKVKNEDKEFRIYNSPAQKRRRTSVEPSPDPEPTRQLSERVSRNKINYSLLSKNGSGKATPSSSSSNLMRLAEMEEDDEGMEDGEATNVVKPMEEDEDPMDIGHWKIRNLLRDEFGVDAPIKCPDCPFESPDAKILENHRFFHSPNGPTRPFVCSECTFNTITPTALIQHLKVHNDGNDEDMRHAKNPRLQKHQRKGDTIPHGVKGYSCTSCSFKTTTEHKLKEHTAIHRVHLINRIRVSMKRQPPKAEYQRPKMKHLMVAKNAKHCKKCTFKCVTQSVFIEHLDRHGWNQLYKCKICDYSDACKSVVDFHQMHHHSVKDQTLRGIIQATKIRIEHGHIQNPENADAAPTPEEIVKRSGSIIKCPLCEYVSHEGSQLAFHMTVEHLNEPNAEETISFLSMGIMPPRTTVVAV